MKLTREEMETIATFNEADTTADVETFSSRLIRDIHKAADMYPDDVTIIDNGDGSIRAIFPKKWIKVRAPRILTDEQRAEIAERFKRTDTSNQ